MKSYYQNKTVIVTGSSRGLGRELATHIWRGGGQVVLHGRGPQENLDSACQTEIKEGRAVYVRGDIESKETAEALVHAAVSHFGGIDVLINNAGISHKGSFLESDIQVVNQVVQTNLMAVLQLTHLALPHILKSKGHILMISSLAGFVGLPDYLPYSVSKMALRAASESLGIELKKQGVHVGIIYFGFVQNDEEKYTLSESGQKLKVPIRNKRLTLSKEQACRCVEKVLSKRIKSITPGWIGKTFYFLSKYMSSIFYGVLTRQYYKQKES